MKIFFKRLGAYIIDYMIVIVLSSLLCSISFINPQYDKYMEYYDARSELITQYSGIISDLSKYNEDEMISTDEFNSLKESYPIFDFVFSKYDEDYSKEKYNEMDKELTSLYNEKGNEITYHLEQNMLFQNGIFIVLIIIYFAIIPIFTDGVTLGKRIFKLKVVKIDGKSCNFANYLIRSVILFSIIFTLLNMTLCTILNLSDFITVANVISIINEIVTYVIIFMVIMREDSRGLHDILGGTKVISTSDDDIEDKKEVPSEKVEITKKKKTIKKDEVIKEAVVLEEKTKKKSKNKKTSK